MRAVRLAERFDVPGRVVTVTATGSGNVNDTYLAILRTTFSEERFILQRLNTRVFLEPRLIMENMRRVTEHVHHRLEEEQERADRIWQLPRVIPTREGDDYLVDEDGSCWRAISLIASAHSFDKVQNADHAQEAGLVLGQFQRLISDLPPDSLHDTLEGFHVTPGYLEHLDRALAEPESRGRLRGAAEAERLLRFIDDRRGWCSVLEDARAGDKLRLRPIHGDPKIANVMIDDATGKGTCIVDLDTVKPGLVHYDFGDCLRSACNPAGEETTELGKVRFDADLCRAIVSGYMRHARSFLTDEDRAYLYDAVRLITFELGLRFFADFVAGNRYFKVRHELQNFDRARVQLKLCESIEIQEALIRRILDET